MATKQKEATTVQQILTNLAARNWNGHAPVVPHAQRDTDDIGAVLLSRRGFWATERATAAEVLADQRLGRLLTSSTDSGQSAA